MVVIDKGTAPPSMTGMVRSGVVDGDPNQQADPNESLASDALLTGADDKRPLEKEEEEEEE